MAAAVILGKCTGLNTREHPHNIPATKLSTAVNVDVTDAGAVELRCGHTTLSDSLANAHSLCGFRDRYAIFADGANLHCYDTAASALSTVVSNLTPDLPLDYTEFDSALVFSNGVQRGLLVADSGSVLSVAYPAFVPDPTLEDNTITEFPTVNLIHYYRGSMYGADRGARFLYGSVPYRVNYYDNSGGYITSPGEINDIGSVPGALLLATDAGLVAFVGAGVHDFSEKVLLPGAPVLVLSGRVTFTLGLGADSKTVSGVLALCSHGIALITDSLEVVELTNDVPVDYTDIAFGSFGVTDGAYIFSGDTQ